VFPIPNKSQEASRPLAYFVVLKLTAKARYYGAILPSEYVAKENVFEMLHTISAELAAVPLQVVVRVPGGIAPTPLPDAPGLG